MVYRDLAEQDFQAPCFLVQEMKRVHEREIGDFQRTNYSIIIKYFPSNPNCSKECWDQEFQLMKLFRLYEDLKLLPTSMESEVVAGVLEFRINFSIRYKIKTESGPDFVELNVQTGMK